MPGRVILILGPTAVGKTDVAMALYDALGGAGRSRLISVDSALVYRGMDIGTAKPSSAELLTYPHALIDIRDPAEPYTVADFVADADREVQAAVAAGEDVILVGGTMLYAKRFVEGIADLPESDPQRRQALQEELQTRGAQALHAELTAIDPVAASEIHPHNPQRLLRAVEVIRVTGTPLSRLWQDRAGQDAASRLGMEPSVYGLAPDSRSRLHERIEKRFAVMLEKGFLDEVRALRSRGDLTLDMPSMRAVGYRQAWRHLAGEIDFDRFVADAKTATRRLAKRQLTWMRQWQGLIPVDSGDRERIAARIVQDIE